MRNFLFTLFIFFMLSNNFARGNVLFYDDCETKPLNGDKWILQGDGRNGKSLSASTETARAGNASYKFVLPIVPTGVDTHIGITLLKHRNFSFNKVYWLGFSIYIPSNIDLPAGDNKWVLSPQFHDEPDLANGCDIWRNPLHAIFLTNSNPGFNAVIRAQYPACGAGKTYDRTEHYRFGTLQNGSWHDFVYNFRFSYTSGGGGFFKIWLNNNLVVNDSGANCFNDTRGPYFWIGLYGPVYKTTTVFVDEIRLGDSSSSYDEVAPKGLKKSIESLGTPILQINKN